MRLLTSFSVALCAAAAACHAQTVLADDLSVLSPAEVGFGDALVADETGDYAGEGADVRTIEDSDDDDNGDDDDDDAEDAEDNEAGDGNDDDDEEGDADEEQEEDGEGDDEGDADDSEDQAALAADDGDDYDAMVDGIDGRDHAEMRHTSQVLAGHVRDHLSRAREAMESGDADAAASEHEHAKRALRHMQGLAAGLEDLHDETEGAIRDTEDAHAAFLESGSGRTQSKTYNVNLPKVTFPRGAAPEDVGRELHPDKFGNYNIQITDTDVPAEVNDAVAPAARKIFRSFMRWFEKVYVSPRGNGGATGGCFGMDCKLFGRPAGMHKKN